MHEIERKLIDLGIIDTDITLIKVDDWFENVTISFISGGNIEILCCFINCLDVELKHDKTYEKDKRCDGQLNYKYFTQDITINEVDDFYEVIISAWPFYGKITCKDLIIKEK